MGFMLFADELIDSKGTVYSGNLVMVSQDRVIFNEDGRDLLFDMNDVVSCYFTGNGQVSSGHQENQYYFYSGFSSDPGNDFTFFRTDNVTGSSYWQRDKDNVLLRTVGYGNSGIAMKKPILLDRGLNKNATVKFSALPTFTSSSNHAYFIFLVELYDSIGSNDPDATLIYKYTNNSSVYDKIIATRSSDGKVFFPRWNGTQAINFDRNIYDDLVDSSISSIRPETVKKIDISFFVRSGWNGQTVTTEFDDLIISF
jgi:hypothetical protein